MLTRIFILYKIESLFQNLIMNIFLQLTVNKDQKLLHQLGFSDEQVLTVKTSGSGTPSGSSADSSTSSSNSSSVFSSSYAMEQVQHNSLKTSIGFGGSRAAVGVLHSWGGGMGTVIWGSSCPYQLEYPVLSSLGFLSKIETNHLNKLVLLSM